MYAESSGKPAAWWDETTVDLRGEPSGIARAYFEEAPVTVYDIEESALVSPRLAALVGARSGAWVPMITEERVVGVLVLATTDETARVRRRKSCRSCRPSLRKRRSRSSGFARQRRSRTRSSARSAPRRSCAGFGPSSIPTRSFASRARSSPPRSRSTRSRSMPPASRRRSTSSVRARSRRTSRRSSRWSGTRSVLRFAPRRLLAESSRQARVQRGFYRIASLLGEPVSPAEAYDAAAQAATDALGGDFAAVLARGAGGSSFVGGHDLRPEVRELPIPEALTDAAEDGHMLAAPTSSDDDRFGDEWRRASFSSLLAIPVRGEQAELVLVFFDEPHTFSHDDLELAQQVARAARGAFERSRLFDAERTARSLAQQLARTGSLLATELDPAAVVDAVVAEACELLRVDAAALDVARRPRPGDHCGGGRWCGRRDRHPFAARCERAGRRRSVALAGDVRRRVAERQPARTRRLPRRRARCVPRCAAERARRRALRRAVRLRPSAAGLARRRGAGARRARRERGRGADERGAVPARRRRARAERRDPREHRGRDRRRRSRRSRGAVEPLGRGDHRGSRE